MGQLMGQGTQFEITHMDQVRTLNNFFQIPAIAQHRGQVGNPIAGTGRQQQHRDPQ